MLEGYWGLLRENIQQNCGWAQFMSRNQENPNPGFSEPLPFTIYFVSLYTMCFDF